MSKQQNIPALRFPEFEGEWEVSQIGNYTEAISGIALKGDEITQDSSGKVILRGINITEGEIRHSYEIDRYYKGKGIIPEKYLVLKGDMVLGMDGSKVGHNVAIVKQQDENSILIQRVARIRAKKNGDINFIYQKVFSSDFHKYVDAVNTSSAIPHISLQQIKDYTIGFPPLPEQQKIASFLTAIDTRIEQLTRKKALLEQYKKGVMQQIFSQQLRFKDDNGKDFPDWEEKKLGEIIERSKNKYDPEKNDINYICIELESIGQGTGMLLNTFNSKEQKSIKNKFKKGDILFGKLRPYLKKYYKANFEGVCSSEIWVLRGKKISSDFLYYVVQTEEFISATNITSGSKMPRAEWSQISSLSLSYPSAEEQQKIVNFITAIDNQINFTADQLDQTKTYKKGLLQQLFV